MRTMIDTVACLPRVRVLGPLMVLLMTEILPDFIYQHTSKP